jgi:hypothetical protein
MDIMQPFMAYARDFERTLADDEWARLRQYFADDAVYEVQAEGFGCRLVGPAAIFAGMKKSLDGFDRKFTRRDIAVTSGPEIADDQMRMGWSVTYHRDGSPPFVLRGRSSVHYAGGKIVHLIDAYDASVGTEFATWQRASGLHLDPSYV